METDIRLGNIYV